MVSINQEKKTLNKQKNTSLIIQVLKEGKKMRRTDLYKEVMKKQKEKFGKSTTYQVIGRDVSRLMQNRFVKIVEGGHRSQIIELIK